MLVSYAQRKNSAGVTFTSEEFRQDVKATLPQPPDDRAFGSVFRRAAKAGVIKKLGFVPALTRHCAPTVMWGKP